jgi:hypothetical protein
MDQPHIRRAVLLGALAALPLAAGCEDDALTDPTPEGVLQLELTSAPATLITSVRVWISHAYLLKGDSLDSEPQGRVHLFDDPASPLPVDLLSFGNGTTTTLGPFGVNEGTFRGLRVVVDSAFVTLEPGFTFEDGSRTGIFTIPETSSMSTSGVKVLLAGDLESRFGVTTTLLLDFDVETSFRLVGPDPATNGGTVRDLRFYPVIRETQRVED